MSLTRTLQVIEIFTRFADPERSRACSKPPKDSLAQYRTSGHSREHMYPIAQISNTPSNSYPRQGHKYIIMLYLYKCRTLYSLPLSVIMSKFWLAYVHSIEPLAVTEPVTVLSHSISERVPGKTTASTPVRTSQVSVLRTIDLSGTSHEAN